MCFFLGKYSHVGEPKPKKIDYDKGGRDVEHFRVFLLFLVIQNEMKMKMGRN